MKKVIFIFVIIGLCYSAIAQEYEIINNTGKVGVKNSVTGKIIIKTEYAGIQLNTDSTGFYVMKDNKLGFIDLNGKLIITFKYKYLS